MRHPDITLRLNDIRDLFVAPAADPFSEHETAFMGQSGIERVTRRLIEHVDESNLPRLVIKIPKTSMKENLEEDVRKSLNRYADLKIEEVEHQAIVIRKLGSTKVFPGLLFLVLCLAMAALLESRFVPFPEVLKTILGEGFTIIGWIVLWHPVEYFLYAPGEIREENRVYRFLKRLPISITAE